MESESESSSENDAQLLNKQPINNNNKSFLSTQGCCFFCFKIIKAKVKSEESEICAETYSEEERFIFSLQSICSYLNIDFPNEKKNVELCESCKATIKRFTKLLEHFEKIQMEMDYYLERINENISEAYKQRELIQVYSQRMTGNRETLAQLALIDKLRKEIGSKISTKLKRKRQLFLPIIRMSEEEVDKVLSVGRQTHQQACWDEIDDDDDSGPVSPAPSPPLLNLQHRKEEKGEADSSPSDPPPRASPGTKTTFNSKTGKFNCTGCPKEFKSKMGCWFHYQSIHLQKRYKCRICKIAEFSHPHTFKDHQLICKDTLQQRLAKEKAKRNVSREKHHKCNICEKKFCKPSALVNHQKRVHLKEKNHPCDICLKRFNNRRLVREHKNSVHLKKTFFCKVCLKTFRRGNHSKEKIHKQICLKKQLLRKQKQGRFKKENNHDIGPSSSVNKISTSAVIEAAANIKVEGS